MDHEYYNGLSIVLLCWCAGHYFGPATAKYLDKEVDKYEQFWNESREAEKKNVLEQIKEEEYAMESIKANEMLVLAKREAVHIQQETEYRRRLMTIYEAVKHRLTYHMQIDVTKRKFLGINLIDWVVREVVKGITPDWDKSYNDYCIDLLEKMPKNG